MTDTISTESKFAMQPWVFRVAFVNGNEAMQVHVVASYAEGAIECAVRHVANDKFSHAQVVLCERSAMVSAISSSVVADVRIAALRDAERAS